MPSSPRNEARGEGRVYRLAVRYVESRDEVTRLTKERAACTCEREWPPYADAYDPCPPDREDRPTQEPCFKARTPLRYINHEGDTEGGDLAPVETWCEPCQRRHALHVQIRPAQRRMAARLSALISATRATPEPTP